MFSRCTKKTGGRARKRHESETCSDATALVTVISAPVLRPFVFLNSILPLASWDPLHHLCSLGRIYARLEGQEFFNPWHDWRGGGIRSIEYREEAKILFKYETYAGNRTSLVPSDGIYYPLPNDLIILSPFRKKGGKERWMEHDCFFEYRFVTKIWRLKYLTFDRIRELEFSRKNGLEASLVSIGSKVKVTLRL